MVEAAYVGTTGRDLVGLVNINVVPDGALTAGVLGNADLSVPVNRTVLDSGPGIRCDRTRWTTPSPRLTTKSQLAIPQSPQVTRADSGKTSAGPSSHTRSSRSEGTLAPGLTAPSLRPERTYGILESDRTHVLNVSWNAMLPDGARGRFDSRIGGGPSYGGSCRGSRACSAARQSIYRFPVRLSGPASRKPTSERPTCSDLDPATFWSPSSRCHTRG